MLVLSRKRLESIRISDNIVVTLLEIQRNKVSLGIDAPKEIPVLRTELQNQNLGQPRIKFRSKAKVSVSNNHRAIEAWETEGGADE